MLEKMREFFEQRLDGYDAHMLNDIESAREFYPYTASLLPTFPECRVLDLGCGTGLELEFYFACNPTAHVTGIDLSEGMLAALRAKFPDKAVELVAASYFDLPLGENLYDSAVSVESLHHFTKEQKIPLYAKLHKALKDGGYFVLTDYFAPDEQAEREHRQTLLTLMAEQGIADGAFYHYDTPLTVGHETEALLSAGFSTVEVMNKWGNTCTVVAKK